MVVQFLVCFLFITFLILKKTKYSTEDFDVSHVKECFLFQNNALHTFLEKQHYLMKVPIMLSN